MIPTWESKVKYLGIIILHILLLHFFGKIWVQNNVFNKLVATFLSTFFFYLVNLKTILMKNISRNSSA